MLPLPRLEPAPSEPALGAAPPLSADLAWDEAFLRVQSYLRAHGLESPVLLNQITAGIIQEARTFPGERGADSPVAAAMEVTHRWIGAWFARSGQEIDWADERMRAQGRLALILADVPGRWSTYFLSAEPVPADLASALTSFRILPGPEVRLSAMPPAPLEFGFSESGDPVLATVKMWLPARAMISWLLIVGFFGVAWAAGH